MFNSFEFNRFIYNQPPIDNDIKFSIVIKSELNIYINEFKLINTNTDPYFAKKSTRSYYNNYNITPGGNSKAGFSHKGK